MELVFIIVASVVALLMVWTLWQLQKLQKHLNVYNDYVGEVREGVISEVITEEFLGQLRNQAQLQLTNTVRAMDEELKQALGQSYQQLMQNIEQEAARIINGELEEYRKTISDAKLAASNVSSETERQLSEIRSQVQGQAESAVREEKKRLSAELEAKLSDIVVYYLVEALGEGVDLGSQRQYILQQLEAHKEDIKKDINDEF